MNQSIILVLAFALTGCIAIPSMDPEESSPSCKTFTRSMSLKSVQFNPSFHDEVGLAAVVAVSAGSVLISGSIVLTNNTVHWLEYQGTCSDSYLNATKQKFLDSFDFAKPLPKS